MGTDVRRVVDDLPHAVGTLAQRTDERSVWSGREFEGRVTDHLTDRQLSALQTAYLAGYHDRPRTSTGEEVAEALGVSPSTFHQHHRVGIRKLLTASFERSTDREMPE
jgi:predicted DNA binding protein